MRTRKITARSGVAMGRKRADSRQNKPRAKSMWQAFMDDMLSNITHRKGKRGEGVAVTGKKSQLTHQATKP